VRAGHYPLDAKPAQLFAIRLNDEKLERATGIEPVLPAWEGKYSTLYFQHLQNRSQKMCVHALHTVHALPDLRIAAGRFAGRCVSSDGTENSSGSSEWLVGMR